MFISSRAFHRLVPGLDVDGDGHSPVEELRGRYLKWWWWSSDGDDRDDDGPDDDDDDDDDRDDDDWSS